MKDFLDYASECYYAGNPIMSDAEFDVLVAHYDYKGVGHKVTDGIPHYWQMYSLQNIWKGEDSFPFDIENAVETPKLDGAAVSILYVNGRLSLGLTRGDGKQGKNITEKVALLVPNEIDLDGIVQITGEVVCNKIIKNSRNVAAGALGLKSLDEFKTRNTQFVAYGIQGTSWEYTYYTSSMHFLKLSGFRVVIDPGLEHEFPTDGVVYRLNNQRAYESMGYTSKFPKGAFALKERKSGEVTTLLDVVWQVGKSGVVSPVAILEPVEIGGASVSKATLHNMEYIDSLDLELGCEVEVIRSGEIIPRIVRRVA